MMTSPKKEHLHQPGSIKLINADNVGVDLEDKASLIDLNVMAKSVSKSVTAVEFAIAQYLFPELPDSYTLRKKLLVTKTITPGWAIYDLVQIAGILVYVYIYLRLAFQSELTFNSIQNHYIADIFIAQLFVVDFLLYLYMRPTLAYLVDINTIINFGSVIPSFLQLVPWKNGTVFVSLNFLKCVRVVYVLKIAKNMKYMNSLSGLRRQVVHLTLLLLIMIIIATGVVHLTENLVDSCKYISAATDWEPSCTESAPAAANCECITYDCTPYYYFTDREGEPGHVICNKMTGLDAFYYIIVTTATIGYGDVRVTSVYARAAVVIFIALSVVLIPMKLSELQNLLSLSNPYSKPYVQQANENHVIISGHTTNKRKLETFLSEFFHPDRTAKEGEEYVICVCYIVLPSFLFVFLSFISMYCSLFVFSDTT
jgi:hypothetical protein